MISTDIDVLHYCFDVITNDRMIVCSGSWCMASSLACFALDASSGKP